MKPNLLIGAVAIVAFGLGLLVSSLVDKSQELITIPGSKEAQSIVDLSNGLTLDGFSVRGEVTGYYTTQGREGYPGEIQTCDVLVVTNSDIHSSFISRYRIAQHSLSKETSPVHINLNLANIDPTTKKAIIASSPNEPITAIITDFEELGHGAGPCYSTLDLIQLK